MENKTESQSNTETIEFTLSRTKKIQLIVQENWKLIGQVGPVFCRSGEAKTIINLEEGFTEQDSEKTFLELSTIFKVPTFAEAGAKVSKNMEYISTFSKKRSMENTWTVVPQMCTKITHRIFQQFLKTTVIIKKRGFRGETTEEYTYSKYTPKFEVLPESTSYYDLSCGNNCPDPGPHPEQENQIELFNVLRATSFDPYEQYLALLSEQFPNRKEWRLVLVDPDNEFRQLYFPVVAFCDKSIGYLFVEAIKCVIVIKFPRNFEGTSFYQSHVNGGQINTLKLIDSYRFKLHDLIDDEEVVERLSNRFINMRMAMSGVVRHDIQLEHIEEDSFIFPIEPSELMPVPILEFIRTYGGMLATFQKNNSLMVGLQTKQENFPDPTVLLKPNSPSKDNVNQPTETEKQIDI